MQHELPHQRTESFTVTWQKKIFCQVESACFNKYFFKQNFEQFDDKVFLNLIFHEYIYFKTHFTLKTLKLLLQCYKYNNQEIEECEKKNCINFV